MSSTDINATQKTDIVINDPIGSNYIDIVNEE